LADHKPGLQADLEIGRVVSHPTGRTFATHQAQSEASGAADLHKMVEEHPDRSSPIAPCKVLVVLRHMVEAQEVEGMDHEDAQMAGYLAVAAAGCGKTAGGEEEEEEEGLAEKAGNEAQVQEAVVEEEQDLPTVVAPCKAEDDRADGEEHEGAVP